MARQANFSALTHDDLLYALKDLIGRKRVTPIEIRGAAQRGRRIAALEAELARLRGAVAPRRPGRPPRAASAAPAAPAVAGAKPKRHITNTPALKAARIWQGRYLGRLRKLSPRDRSKVKAFAKENGVPAAVKLADRMLG
jgi:hypothetical protein